VFSLKKYVEKFLKDNIPNYFSDEEINKIEADFKYRDRKISIFSHNDNLRWLKYQNLGEAEVTINSEKVNLDKASIMYLS
jgi:hypothetical protein